MTAQRTTPARTHPGHPEGASRSASVVEAAYAIAAGDLPQAHQIFRDLLLRFPDDPHLNNRVGDFLALSSRLPEATAYCLLAARHWHQRGDSRRARAVIAKVLRWQPGHREAMRLNELILGGPPPAS